MTGYAYESGGPLWFSAGVPGCLVRRHAAWRRAGRGRTRPRPCKRGARAHDGAAFLAGIDLELADGWKTYWEKPGDSGIPPVFDWSASENVAGVELRWPAPERFDAPGDITFGYKHGLTWPRCALCRKTGRAR
ncbi:protein-disulfide reductase DsbD domain-containing protein [Parvibaculum sp.]|uniref:protein-disulfide reductase DsbD domain-containing protein n=1 Tax=Parvibaculum sp. TaxID=2024848 RepID=UPI003BAC6F69